MSQNHERSFTIRLPVELVDQIDMRCHINFRSRNKEILALLTYAIDNLVGDHRPTAQEKQPSDPEQTTEE